MAPFAVVGRSRRDFLCFGATALAVDAAYWPFPATAQDSSTAPSNGAPQDQALSLPPDEAQSILQELRSVVAELFELSSGDQVLRKLLPDLVVTMDRRYVRLSPNAYASTEDGQRLIEVDLAYIYRIWRWADFAAAMQFVDADEVVSNAAQDYGARLGSAKRQGTPPPELSFEIADTGLPAMLKAEIRDIASAIVGAMTAWIVLHEVGHHALNHLRNPRQPLEKQREQELAADQFATTQFLDLGYGPYPLQMALELLSANEKVYEMEGFLGPEEQSTHPRWQSRLSQFQSLVQDQEAPRFPMYAIRTWTQDGGGTPFAETYGFPSDPSTIQSIGLLQSGDKPGICGVERRGTSAVIYARPLSGLRAEIMLEHLDKFWVEGRAQTFPGGEPQRFRAYQVSVATRRSVLPGIPGIGSGLMDGSAARELNAKLMTPPQAAQVNAIQADSLKLQLGSFLQYMKGATSLQQYQSEATRLAQEYSTALDGVLGESGSAAYQQAAEKWAREHAMTDAITSRLQAWKR